MLCRNCIEIATEKIGVDAWLDILTGKGGGLIKNLAKQSGSEGIEEGMSYLAGWLMDVVQNDPDAKFSAQELLTSFSLQELLTSAAGGALSGLILGGGTAAMVGKDNYILMRNDETSRQAEQAEQQAGTIDDIAIPVQDEQTESGRDNGAVTINANDAVYGLSEEDAEQYMKTGKKASTRHRKSRMLEAGSNPIIRTVQEFRSFVKSAINGESKDEIKTYGKTSDRLVKAVFEKSGGNIDISDMFMELDANDINHSFKEHSSAKQAGDINLSVADYENIAEYINGFDDIIYAEKTGQGIRIQIGKKINGYSIITEIVSNERNAVKFRNMWGVSTRKYEQKYKNRGRANRPDTQKVSSVPSGTNPYLNNIIPQGNQTMQDAVVELPENSAKDNNVPGKFASDTDVGTTATIKESSGVGSRRKAAQVAEKARNKAQKQLLRKKLTDSGKSDVVKQLEAFEKRTGINVWFYNGELEDMGGFAYKGEMFLDISDPDILLTTAIHESIHLYKNNNIDKFNKLRDRIFRLEEDQKSEYGEIGFWTRDAYTEIYGNDTDAINEEVVAKLCEICVNNPEQFFDTLGKEKTIIEIIADILREIKNTITIKLTNSEQAKIDNALIALERYLRGDAGVSESTRFSKKYSEEHKAQQFNLLQNTNPMHDDYHTGIRSMDDIYTAEEVFTEDEFMGTPDWTLRDAETALNNGTVTVYSSYPISDGVFVTPSRMIAQDYAGNGRVFSKNVPLESVAWIDSDEGQYAPVNNGIRFSKNTLKNRYIIEKSEKTRYTNSRWVKDNSIVSDREYEDFISKVMSIKTGTHFEKASNGLYIIPTGDEFGINNTLIFTDGNSNNPSIEKVVHINLDNETAIEKVRDVIYGKEINNWRPKSDIAGDLYGEKNFKEYTKSDFHNIRSSAGRRQRSARGKDTGNNQQQQNRAGNSGQSEKTLAGYISESIEDYAEGKNAYFVTLADGKRRRFNRYENKTGLHIRINGRDYSSLKDMVKTENAKIMGASDGAPFKLSRKIERKAIPEEYQGMSTQEITKALIEKHGAHKKGEKITNEVSVPKKDMQGRNVAKGSQTIMEASATKESMLDDYQKAIAAGAFSYDVNRDKDAVDKAVKYIEDNGFRNTLDYWKSKISNDEALTKDDMAKAQIMYAVAVANDDYDTAMELAVDIINLY